MQKIFLLLTITGLLSCTPLPNTGNNADSPKEDETTNVLSDENRETMNQLADESHQAYQDFLVEALQREHLVEEFEDGVAVEVGSQGREHKRFSGVEDEHFAFALGEQSSEHFGDVA